MKRTIPLLITALSGLVLVVSVFIPAWQSAGEEVAIWFDILASIAFVLGGGNLLRLHLRNISNQHAGWGYSAITLISFVVMLLLGMFKVGCPPEPGPEAYGSSMVKLPLSAMPEFRITASIPERGDGEPLPKSVAMNVREENGELVFQGWMSSNQRDDLAGYQDIQSWKCDVEKLFALAQAPQELAGRVRYDVNQRALFFEGRMSTDDKAALGSILPEHPQAVDQLFELANRPTARKLTDVPDGFSIPESAAETLTFNDDVLEVHGPLTEEMRAQIVGPWSNVVRARPLTPSARESLLSQIQDQGPLNEAQLQVFNNFFDADWKADQFIAAINTAGILQPKDRSACELLEDLKAGIANPPLKTPAPPPQTLNEAQQQAVTDYVNSEVMTGADLSARLVAAGPITPRQLEAVTAYLNQQPTLAEQHRGLAFRLMEEGPLTTGQINFLLDPIRAQYRFRKSVSDLFIASQQVKYPWSGNYTAQGSPFWWLYEYVYQPLLTTTFAVLAFYVASAAYRAFRAKNLEAILLLGTAFLILLGRTSAGPALTNWLPESLSFLKMDNLMVYIMSIFNTAGNRAIMIGIALGTISTSLRVLLGIDRSYLGSGK